jgi:hypothetical protein
MPDPMQIIDGQDNVIVTRRPPVVRMPYSSDFEPIDEGWFGITPGGSGHIDGKPDGDGIEGFGG